MLESILLVLSLCIDGAVASFAYGTNKIKIPFLSGLIITAISTLFLLLSTSLGSCIKHLLPSNLTTFICFAFLLCLGISRLFEGLLKTFLGKKATSPDHIEFNLFDFKLILNVYADATLADLDHSKTLSSKEALYLGIALALDSLIIGFGAALSTVNLYEITFFSVLFNALFILLGSYLGRKCAEKCPLDLSWLSGVILILLAFLKFI